MKYKIDGILKVELKLSVRFDLSKLNILKIFILIETVYILISQLF
jgi:hypothetical protein